MAAYLPDGVLLYLNQLVDWQSYYRLRKGDDVDVEAERAALLGVLETASEICALIETESRAGWDRPARLVDGDVVLPEHTQKGYERLREAGLVCLGISERYGGFELPALISGVVTEMIARADASLMTIVGLQAGVAEDIQSYASEELCQQYLPRFASGELQGAMDLTEPQAGSDLGAIVTRALDENGHSYVDGQKIFITNGGADVHLVLARDADTFEESKGTTRGLSLLVCPRMLPDGSRNNVTVERLEHKLGIHGSPTAAVRFNRAEAFRIGEKGEGFKAMLNLMNQARLGVAAQGIGIAQAAIDEAVRYAKERRQFGKPIGEQPLMKNMLSRMILNVEASRALLYRCLALIDRNRSIEAYLERNRDTGDPQCVEYQALLERNLIQIRLLTPLAKYLATESCDDITRIAIQVHGGMGFMAETTVGKLHLDGIITTIYEGTSEIQVSFALKEIGKGALGTVFDELNRELDELHEDPLAGYAMRVAAGIDRIIEASEALLKDFDYALLSARHIAEMVIHVVVGTELLRQAKVSPRRLDLAAYWVNRKMLELEMSAARITEGGVERIERFERIVELFG